MNLKVLLLRNVLGKDPQIFWPDVSIKTWYVLKTEHELLENSNIQWLQVINVIPGGWKLIIKKMHKITPSFVIHDHQILKNLRALTLDKLTINKIYSILI